MQHPVVYVAEGIDRFPALLQATQTSVKPRKVPFNAMVKTLLMNDFALSMVPEYALIRNVLGDCSARNAAFAGFLHAHLRHFWRLLRSERYILRFLRYKPYRVVLEPLR